MHRRVGNAHARFSATPEPDGKWRQRRLSAWHFCRGGVWAYRFAGAAVSWKRMRSRRGRRWFRAPFRSRNPGCGTPVLPPEAFDLAIVPAVAFDREGYRLGRGGGYYDRYLEQTNCVKAGLCFESFLLPSVPHEAHDVRMDRIFTEEGEYIWV